jgi:hypothetical protein
MTKGMAAALAAAISSMGLSTASAVADQATPPTNCGTTVATFVQNFGGSRAAGTIARSCARP